MRMVRQNWLISALLVALASTWSGSSVAAPVTVQFFDTVEPPLNISATVSGTTDFNISAGDHGLEEIAVVHLFNALAAPADAARTWNFGLREPGVPPGQNAYSDVVSFHVDLGSTELRVSLVSDFHENLISVPPDNPPYDTAIETGVLQPIPLPGDLPTLSYELVVQAVSDVPEPPAAVLLLTAVACFGFIRLWRQCTTLSKPGFPG